MTAAMSFGVLPDGWRMGRIKDLIGSSANGVWGDEPLDDGLDVYCVRAADFNRDALAVLPDKLPLRRVEPRALGEHRLRSGDLVWEKSGGGENQPVGLAVNFDLNVTAVCSNFCTKVTPSEGTDGRYLAYVFAAAYFAGLNQRSIKQTTGLQNLDGKAFLVESWPVPPLSEQRRIADFLDEGTSLLHRAAASKGSLQALLQERLKAVRDLSLDALRKRHGEVSLRRMVRGVEQGSSPACDSWPSGEGEWGVLKLSSVKRGEFYPHENKRLAAGAALARYEIREGDLLVTRANTPELVGDVAVASGDVARKLLPDLVYRLRLSGAVKADYVAEVLLGRRVRALIEATARGTSQSMVKLRGEDIKSWPIPNAGMIEQNEFVHRMRQESRQVRILTEAIERQQQLIFERRRALIVAAVTGQIDVATSHGVTV
ncbi:restriction endonuclease subunit S [Micromonospora carbonacea]|uniref:restriction endonuclease subunit S n=1 Tax=Micromonospora carbonacea TaxID=47853 RepID=UPI003717F0E8